MSKHDQAALDAATQIIDLFSSPGQWRDTWHLKHKVQCLLIDLLERNATQPAAGEPVANNVNYADEVDLIRAVLEGYSPSIARADALCSVKLLKAYFAAPPAAANGDEAATLAKALSLLWEATNFLPRGGSLDGRVSAFLAQHAPEPVASAAAMRAQGDGEVQ